MPARRRICSGRLDRAGTLPAKARRAAARYYEPVGHLVYAAPAAGINTAELNGWGADSSRWRRQTCRSKYFLPQVPTVEAHQFGGSGGSRGARNESFIDIGEHPVFGITTLFEDNRRPSNFFPTRSACTRARARSKQSIDAKCCKVGSKVEAIPCFKFSLAKKLHLFRDARS